VIAAYAVATSDCIKSLALSVGDITLPAHVKYVFTHSSIYCKLSLTIASPNLLSALETLDNWTDGRISSRHSAPTCFLFIYSAHLRNSLAIIRYFQFYNL